MASRKNYYAVAVGETTGIYSKWFGPGGAQEQVRGYPGARYKGFATMKEARAFLEANRGSKQAGCLVEKRASDDLHRSATRDQAPPPVEEGRIVIYTDGSALTNPGPGGYGVVIADGRHGKELSGGFRLTTNNRMELLACIVGLSDFKQPASIVVYSDSKYVISGITKGWAKKWRANGWMRNRQDPAVNPDLWERLLSLCQLHTVEFRWVKGHAGIEGNERCDSLATRAASGRNLPPDRVYEKSIAARCS